MTLPIAAMLVLGWPGRPVNVGDMLVIRPNGFCLESPAIQVGRDGLIRCPYRSFGDLKVAGLTTKQVAERLSLQPSEEFPLAKLGYSVTFKRKTKIRFPETARPGGSL